MKTIRKITVVVLCFALTLGLFGGCATELEKSDESTEKSQVDYEEKEAAEELFVEIDGDLAYFDETAESFVENYNAMLTTDADIISRKLNKPKYTYSGTGVQKVTIYQYDVSNLLGTVHTFVHADESGKILEVVIGVEKVLGSVTANTAELLYYDMGDMATVLTGISEDEWKILADGLSQKIVEKSSSLYYYYKGILLDTYSDEQAVYFRISSMTPEKYSEL